MRLAPLRAGTVDRAVEEARKLIGGLVFEADQFELTEQKGASQFDVVDGPPDPIRPYVVHADTQLR